MNAIDQVFVNGGRLIVELVTQLGLPAWVATFVGMLLPVTVVLAIFPAFFAFLTWMERKVLARIQNRLGPNRVGPFGLLQPIADGMKMMTKEDIVPRAADKLLHILGPILVIVPSLTVYALLPFGKGMTPANIDVSVMLFFAISSISTIALFISGWGSRNKYSLIGAMRAIAQMISYELPLVLAAVPVIMIAGSMSIGGIVTAQGPVADELLGSIAHWYVWKPWGFIGFCVFFVAGMAELNRSPFDIAEGESEIIAGFHTEYSGMKFALFFMAEYLAAIAFCGLAAALFLGGYWGPSFIPSWATFFAKTFALLSLMMWIRGTLPRLRGDQLMGFSWKFLLPLGLVNIVATGTWFYVDGTTLVRQALAWGAAALIVFPTYFLLTRIHGAGVGKKRVYRYADL